MDTVFAPELPGLDRDEVRHWSLPGQWVYTLGYPNREVESSLNAVSPST